jgi:hypothetical protein
MNDERMKLLIALQPKFREAEKFFLKVEKGPSCWIWTGSRAGKNHYGAFYLNGVKYRAHRFSFMIHVGEIPAGLEVLHRCDTPLCVNPDHLFIGTQKDNIHDAINKGRIYDGFLPKETCKHGHPIIVTKQGKRECQTCKKEHGIRYYSEHKNDWNKKRKFLQSLTKQEGATL